MSQGVVFSGSTFSFWIHLNPGRNRRSRAFGSGLPGRTHSVKVFGATRPAGPPENLAASAPRSGGVFEATRMRYGRKRCQSDSKGIESKIGRSHGNLIYPNTHIRCCGTDQRQSPFLLLDVTDSPGDFGTLVTDLHADQREAVSLQRLIDSVLHQ